MVDYNPYDLASISDVDLWSGGFGDAALEGERQRRQDALHGRPGSAPAGSGSPPSLFPVVAAVAIAIPVWIAITLVTAVGRGTAWLAHESMLSVLFAAPGDPLSRYIVGTTTLIVLLPGALVLLAVLLRDTRLRPLGVWVLVPLAALLVPVLIYVTQGTFTENIVRSFT